MINHIKGYIRGSSGNCSDASQKCLIQKMSRKASGGIHVKGQAWYKSNSWNDSWGEHLRLPAGLPDLVGEQGETRAHKAAPCSTSLVTSSLSQSSGDSRYCQAQSRNVRTAAQREEVYPRSWSNWVAELRFRLSLPCLKDQWNLSYEVLSKIQVYLGLHCNT